MDDVRILLAGRGLALAVPRRAMLADYHAWENDPGTLLGYGEPVPRSWESRTAEWERQRADRDHPWFEVVRLADTAPVGLTELEIDPAARTAEFGVILAPRERGRGLAAEAARLTLDWAFHLAALRVVWLRVLEPNRAGIAAYERAGFRHAGRLRRCGYWLGRPVDELLMDALPEEFPGPSAVTDAVGDR